MTIKRSSILKSNVVQAAQKHAREEYLKGKDKPQESIGVVSRGKYVPLKNVSPVPHLSAKPEREKFGNMMADGLVDCLIHSHPNGPFYPSKNDMVGQVNLEIPHGLIAVYQDGACSKLSLWGDQLERQDLNNRYFQHGISDCFEAIRDKLFIENVVNISPFPREWEWWLNGEDLYEDNLKKEGFVVISAHEAKPNDCVLFKMPCRNKKDNRLHVSDKYNHAGVYLGNDTIYHHPSSGAGYSATNLSGLASLSRRMHQNPLFVRYSG